MQVRKPSWWQLYILALMLPASVLLEQFYPVPGLSSEVVDGGIVVLIFAGLLGWIQVNADLIQQHEMEAPQGYDDLEMMVYAPLADAAETVQDIKTAEAEVPLEMRRDAIHLYSHGVAERGREAKWFLN